MDSKKLKRLIGHATLGLLLFTQNIYANAYGNVSVPALNVRSGASTEHKIVSKVGSSDYIHILNKADNGWYAIETDTDQLGYISGQYLDIQKAKGIINTNGVNVRSSADYNAPVISQVYKNNVVYAYAQTGDWYLIQNGEYEGYIHREFVDGLLIDQLPNKKAAAVNQSKPAEKTIAVATTTLNLRKGASTSSETLKKVAPATILSVQNIDGDWVKVSMPDQTEGYLAKQYLNIGKESAKGELLKGISQSGESNQANNIVSYAKQFLGNPYVYGGNSLTNGVDCSGFTSQIYKQFGVSLSRSSASQYANDGSSVSISEARAGDLIFYGYSGSVSHVAMYIGNGQVIHANDPKSGICIGDAFRSSGKPIIGVKRVL